MAYRRRQGITRASTFKEEIHHPPDDDHNNSSSSSANSSLAAKAVRASTAYRDSSSLSSAYGNFSFDSSSANRSKEPPQFEYTSFKRNNEPPKGLWGVLALKAKSILEDDAISQQQSTSSSTLRPQPLDTSWDSQFNRMQGSSFDSNRRVENPRLRKGLDVLASSLNSIGDSIGNALEEGRSMVENKTADIIQETRKLQIRRKGGNSDEQIQVADSNAQTLQSNQETKLKASRDVAMATAAKAKLLLRELKTIKADLAFARERCTQLEEENKILREAREKGVNPADDDMIRLQLETLLNEKSRLANENSIYARENRFLREIVEYHQLTMQDVVYFDEGIDEEVTEVYPIPAISRILSISPPSPLSPPSIHDDINVDQSRFSNSTSTLDAEHTFPSISLPPPPPPPPTPTTAKAGGSFDLTVPQDTNEVIK